MKDSSTYARQSSVHQKAPPTTVPANAGLSPMKRRGPGCPWKYPDANKTSTRAATGNIQSVIQANVSASLIQAEDFEPVRQVFGTIPLTTNQLQVQNGATSWKKFLWNWIC